MNNFLPKKIIVVLFLLLFGASAQAQLTIDADKTATELADSLVGSGVTILSPTLNCPGNANGYFSVTSSTLGIPKGIILTNGCAKDTTIYSTFYYGVANPAYDFASCANGTSGDGDLTALAGVSTYDACVLEFDFKAVGDSVKFNYVFGSEEYSEYTCSEFNDVFGFFITGGSYTTATNIALVPGTSIPVCINSVNCGPGSYGGDDISYCYALGSGSPFCTYYVDNTYGTTVVYDGLTTVLQAVALINPCDTYHLKLGVADGYDDIYDSGVFIEGGSLTSTPPVSVSLASPPYCVRGCTRGLLDFKRGGSLDSALVVHYLISGTGIGGTDYARIPDSITIAAGKIDTILTVTPLTGSTTSPATLSITVIERNTCDTSYTIIDTATLTILDSFNLKINTPDTTICAGGSTALSATGDADFGGMIAYAWSPSATVSADTSLTTVVTPTVTTTYTLTGTMRGSSCSESRTVTVTPSSATVTILTPDTTVCPGTSFTLRASGVGSLDYSWSPSTGLSSSAIANPVVTATATTTYTLTATIAGTTCTSSAAVTVSVPTISASILTPDTSICHGSSLTLRGSGSAGLSYAWYPSSSVTSPSSLTTTATPGTTTIYSLVATSSGSGCTDTNRVTVTVATPSVTILNPDTTICFGSSATIRTSAPAGESFSWSPATGTTTVTSMSPAVTPTATTVYTVTATLDSVSGCSVTDTTTVNVIHVTISALTPDTTICHGSSFTMRLSGSAGYAYAWSPATGLSSSTSMDPVATPSVSTTYTVTATATGTTCTAADTVDVTVKNSSFTLLTSDTTVCYGASFTIRAVNTGDADATYSWSPVTGLATATSLSPVVTPTGNTKYVITSSVPGATCPNKDSLTITVGNAGSNILTPDTTICIGTSFTIRAHADSSSATYSWSPATGLSSTTIAHPVASPTTTTTYTLTVSVPGTSCTETHTVTVTVNGPIVNVLTPDTTICKGASFTLRLSTLDTLSYSWSPTTGLSSATTKDPVASPTSNTTYTVVASTSYGCPYTGHVTVTVGDAHFSILTPDTTICGGYSFPLRIQEDSALTYAWAPATGLSSTSVMSPTATPATTTTYTLIGTADGVCKDTGKVTVVVDTTIVSILTPDTTICYGTSFAIQVLGADSLIYTWSPATGLSSTSVKDPVTSATDTTTYTLYAVSPTFHCPSTNTIKINVADPRFSIITTHPDTTICQGASFVVNVKGNATNSYSWSPATGLSSSSVMTPTFAPTVNTAYVVTDNVPGVPGCADTGYINVFIDSPKVNILTADTLLCINSEFRINAQSSDAVYFSWSPAAQLLSTNVLQPVLSATVLDTTHYVLTGTSVLGCTDTAGVTVSVAPPPTAVIDLASTDICIDQPVMLAFTGTTNGLSTTYTWHLGSAFIDSGTVNSQTIAATFVDSGNQQISVTASAGGNCYTIDTVKVNVLPKPWARFYIKPEICLWDTVTLALTARSDDATNFIWGGDFDNAVIVAASSNSGGPYKIAFGDNLGLHLITLIPETSQGCKGNMVTDTVNVRPLPDAEFTMPKGPVCQGDTVTFVANTILPNYFYQWTPYDFFQYSLPSPATHGIIANTSFITLTVTDNYGCKASDSAQLETQPCCLVALPNAFTPGGTVNTTFYPLTTGHQIIRDFRIANRWGQVVYESTTFQFGWDGKLNGVPQEMDVYFWYLNYDCGGTTYQQHGDVTLIR
jgi:CHU_C Type IX secretion signal domain